MFSARVRGVLGVPHRCEALAIECHRRIDADKTVATLERLVAERGAAPGFIRCDNGAELTANALRDWCRFARTGSAYIEPGSPWQNPYVESFGSRIRDELLSVELFSCLAEARILIEDWRQDYNQHRRHSALAMMAPADSRSATGRPTARPRARCRTALALRARCVRHRQQPYPADQHQPPALTTGGPMNGVRSRGVSALVVLTMLAVQAHGAPDPCRGSRSRGVSLGARRPGRITDRLKVTRLDTSSRVQNRNPEGSVYELDNNKLKEPR